MRKGMVRSAALSVAMVGLFWVGGTQAAQSNGAACIACHEDIQKTHVRGSHAGLDCAQCHSGTTEHLDLPGPTTAPGKPEAISCLSCHSGNAKLMNWKFADHGRAGINCRDCHGIHAPKVVKGGNQAGMIKDKASQACVSCHQEVLARFNMPSHHPVKEGAMSCISCHDPHGSGQVNLASKTAQCTTCHQNVRGPHMVEHPPAAEDCVSCHNPHGSPNRRLLQMAEPMLCLQCHSLAGNRHGQTGANNNTQAISGAVLRKCTSCHSQVHGSSQDQHLRY